MTLVESGVLGEFPYAIQRHDKWAHLCGYLGVPPGHPWYGQSDTFEPPLMEISVHGGVTYSQHEARFERTNILTGERVVREASSPEEHYPAFTGLDVWWVGFDCAHHGDAVPVLWSDGESRDRDFVMAEIELLAHQAAASLARSG